MPCTLLEEDTTLWCQSDSKEAVFVAHLLRFPNTGVHKFAPLPPPKKIVWALQNSRWWNKFHPEDSKILSDTVQILVATVTWRPEFARPSHNVSVTYEACPKSIQQFWISREPCAWPLFNSAASQKGSYCSSVNSHSPVGLVSRQWDVVDWACVLCDRRIHNARASRSGSSRQCAYPFYSSHTGVFGKTSHHPGLSAAPYSPHLPLCDFWLFPKLKSPLKWRRFVNATVTQHTSSVNGVSLLTD